MISLDGAGYDELKDILESSLNRLQENIVENLPKEQIAENNSYFKFAEMLDNGEAMKTYTKGYNQYRKEVIEGLNR